MRVDLSSGDALFTCAVICSFNDPEYQVTSIYICCDFLSSILYEIFMQCCI